ncbi:MAG: asparagine synthase (glutamine-hydrolyzing) [Desulfobacteraceae bacterium]|nr:asparagine synthase (glutamine-hydrolyzing) [Desulfobacteraceae bacterium]MBC2754807.1 asparagine synthase (glutamine-hydrolyzing) [Desulfobacteraceae bacterium]
MCGICGIYNYNKDAPVSEDIINSMNNTMVHRGPDDSGLFIGQFIGLGHRRLSIIDIHSGKQPMCNEDGSIWVTYNGEIYNFLELKDQLLKKGHVFKTNCDTEVIVHAFEEYGFECVLKFNGMFAFAVWDSKNEVLFLARDRLGIKPLYYSIINGNFIFASEIKAILQHPMIEPEVELNSIPEYLFCTSLLNANTMFKDIFSVPAGHTIVFKNKTKQVSEYWDIKLEDIQSGDTSIDRYKEKIFSLLDDSVRMRLMSDVPFGSLLSGGLDSSIISALATRYVNDNLMTFAMEYSKNIQLGKSNIDTEFAGIMANTFQTDHREFIFDPEEYKEVFEKVTWHLEKPIELTTPSLYLLHKSLKQHITVVLSGEGADELLGGYFFFLKEAQTNQLSEFPWAPYFKEVSMLINPEIERETRFKENVKTSLNDFLNKFKTNDFLNKVLYLFIKIYLLEMLERQDKTSMAWSVEARVPFLDHRLVENIVNIPSRYKFKDDNEKYLLKESFRDIIPPVIINRKKKPFPFPVDPMSVYRQKNIANDLVQSGTSRISHYFDKKMTNNFFNKKNEFKGIDSLAIFRTSHSIIALEMWHKAFGV